MTIYCTKKILNLKKNCKAIITTPDRELKI